MQPIPEHPKRDYIFCLSTAFGDAYLFQAPCQVCYTVLKCINITDAQIIANSKNFGHRNKPVVNNKNVEHALMVYFAAHPAVF